MSDMHKALVAASARPRRLWDHFDVVGDCWNWAKARQSDGYGVIYIGGTSALAHRVAYHLWYGAIPKGFCVCHKCDNPACIRPRHLFLGSHADNMRDMKNKGRRKGVNVATDNGRAKLSHDKAQAIRMMFVMGANTKDLANHFCVGRSTIYRVIRKETWS